MKLLYYIFIRYFIIGEIRNRLPKNKWGDKIYALCKFAQTYNRLPENQKNLYDELHRVRTRDIENPLRVITTDKEYLKLYIKATVGDKYNIKTLGIIHNNNELNNFNFPEQCAIKPTAGGGGYQVILKQKNDTINVDSIRGWLSENHYYTSRLRNYKSLVPKIIVEELAFNAKETQGIRLFCVKGKMKMILYHFDFHTEQPSHKLYDRKWNDLQITLGILPLAHKNAKKPKNLEEIIQVAEKLTKPFNFVIVDMYINDEKCYVGELEHFIGYKTFQTNGIESMEDAEQRIAQILFGEK